MHSANWNRRVLVISGDGATRNNNQVYPLSARSGLKARWKSMGEVVEALHSAHLQSRCSGAKEEISWTRER